ncbi:hypothetical protein OESDEN_07456 [Oesophagostomum dentatum]|uniref:Uncharacterized protein n=1 Tax=Oesophagostomum dentatum TaxID=61180 RepID=A0A0B1TBF8_OESDE|nr:hypothetical protein OESDEN_07456 [Oesophagostomum dentatum]
MLPTKEQVEAVPGTPLTKEELTRLQAEGHLPEGMDIFTGAPTLHKLKSGDQEILVVSNNMSSRKCPRKF